MQTFLAYYVHHLSPFLIEFGNGVGIRWYGLSYVAAFVVAFVLYKHLANKGYTDIPPTQVSDFITWTALFGVLLGGRLGYMVFYDWQVLTHEPWRILKVWDGGMSSHGGFLGVMLYTLWYARRHKVSWTNLGDNIVVVAPLGVFFGRLANFINGELYGRVTDVAWAMQFPKELYSLPPQEAMRILDQAKAIDPSMTSLDALIASAPLPAIHDFLATVLTPRHPSQLYAACLEGLFLFLLMWILRTRIRVPNGVLTGVFFIAYSQVRILDEFFREPDAPLTGALTRGQFLSLFLFIIGALFCFFAYRHPTYAPIWKRKKAAHA